MVMCVGCDRVNAYDMARDWGSVCVGDLRQCLDVKESAPAPSVVYSGPVVGM